VGNLSRTLAFFRITAKRLAIRETTVPSPDNYHFAYISARIDYDAAI
jgi:hypothetical protein